MTLWTLGQIKTKVNDDLDLTDEVMITDSEMISNINAAIDEAEQLVHTLYEDYLLRSENLTLTTGSDQIDLPTSIYAHKIRKVFYENGTDKYEIKRIRNLTDIPDVLSTDKYRYLIINTGTGGFKMRLFPASRETSTTNVTIWFIANANTLSLDTDVMNIPEAVRFVIEKTKLLCARKEGHPAQVALEAEVERQKELLVSTLTAMVPDEDNAILLAREEQFSDLF